jgi:DNA gyrase subunit A
MAQDFSLRYPLIDGHGNFGSPDPNDRPAAQRYTEARLAPLAMELLGEIDENTVDFTETYDGQHQQPVVVPARFPNLLVNGGGGIAVGMATNIPPHNLREVIGQKIAELVNDRRIEGIRDVRNESAGDTTRLIVELKRDANAQVVLNQLYKHTPMQTSFAANVLALVDGVPRLLGLVQALQVYIAHQVEVVTRRSEHRLSKARDRSHILEGLLKALDAIDAIITLIRGSESADAAKQALMAAPFDFSEVQATHILDMPLRRLAALERQKVRDEFDELQTTIAELEAILADEHKLRGVIKDEMIAIRDKYGDDRRTEITTDFSDLADLDLIEDEELVVVLSRNGYVKTVQVDQFRVQGRGGKGVRGGNLREEDYVEHLLTTTAHSYLLFFSNRGRVYRLRAHEIPMKDRTARGTALVNLIALQPDEHIEAIIDTRTYEDGAYLFFATRKGMVKKTRMSEYDSSLRSGLIAINLNDGDELVRVIQTSGNDDVFMVSRQGMTIRFSESDVRAMGRATAGVRGMRVTASRGEVVAAFMVGADDEILVFSSGGNIIRMGASEISSQGRDATGVRVARLREGENVVAVAPVLEADGE